MEGQRKFQEDDGQTQTWIERPVVPEMFRQFLRAWHAYIPLTFLGCSREYQVAYNHVLHSYLFTFVPVFHMIDIFGHLRRQHHRHLVHIPHYNQSPFWCLLGLRSLWSHTSIKRCEESISLFRLFKTELQTNDTYVWCVHMTPVAPVTCQVILEPGIGQFCKFELRRAHTCINSFGLFLAHKLACRKCESVS